MALADQANQYIAEKEPWVLVKQEGTGQEVLDICSVGINLFRLIMLYLKPVLPGMTEATEAFLGIDPLSWDDRNRILQNHPINKFKP